MLGGAIRISSVNEFHELPDTKVKVAKDNGKICMKAKPHLVRRFYCNRPLTCCAVGMRCYIVFVEWYNTFTLRNMLQSRILIRYAESCETISTERKQILEEIVEREWSE